MPQGTPNQNAKHSKYAQEDGEWKKVGVECPKCGPGVFMGEHSDRKTCGKCGHSEKQ